MINLNYTTPEELRRVYDEAVDCLDTIDDRAAEMTEEEYNMEYDTLCAFIKRIDGELEKFNDGCWHGAWTRIRSDLNEGNYDVIEDALNGYDDMLTDLVMNDGLGSCNLSEAEIDALNINGESAWDVALRNCKEVAQEINY